MLVACGRECRDDDTLGNATKFDGTPLFDASRIDMFDRGEMCVLAGMATRYGRLEEQAELKDAMKEMNEDAQLAERK